MQRYAVITRKIPREIVLLKGLPCAWGRCTFCHYVEDNTRSLDEIQRVADEVLAKVSGRFGRLEVINSGSILELPLAVREQIRDLLVRRGIEEFICEASWPYRRRFDEIRAFFATPTRIKVGIETFDARLRNEVLNKNVHFASIDEVRQATESICLLVGFRGQTRSSVRRDIQILLDRFAYGCVNVFTPAARTGHLLDESIRRWFAREFRWLDDHPTIEVLFRNTDFGVG